MYDQSHPVHALKASALPTHFLGIDWSSIDWTVWTIAIATIAIVTFIVLRGRNRRGVGGTPSGDFGGMSDASSPSDISWGPGHHSHSGSDAGHHGGFFDGGGGDAGGGHH